MCGIFAYLNYCSVKTREEILEVLLHGLGKLTFKGYDSVGLGIDTEDGVKLLKTPGELKDLTNIIKTDSASLGLQSGLNSHVGIAHTRWATHGPPSVANTHPIPSGPEYDFVVVHNGMLTNFKALKRDLIERDPHTSFDTDTDTEVIAKMALQIFQDHGGKEGISFREIVEHICLKLDGAYALVFKSKHYADECVAVTRSSPLVIGIKTKRKLHTNHIPVYYSEGTKRSGELHPRGPDHFHPNESRFFEGDNDQDIRETNGHFMGDPFFTQAGHGIDFIIASDPKAITPYTNRAIYMKNDDIAAFSSTGVLSLHKVTRNQERPKSQSFKKYLPCSSPEPTKKDPSRTIDDLNDPKDEDPIFKEILEVPESISNTMRGRVRQDTGKVILGGIQGFLPEIKRCRRLMLLGCGTSYHVGLAVRQILEELTSFAVMVDHASDFLDRGAPVYRDDVCVFLSHSGETPDIVESLRVCKKEGALIVGITNTVGSTVSRESHCGVHLNNGPDGQGHKFEIKAFSSQFVSLVMFGLVMAEDIISKHRRRAEIIDGLCSLPDHVYAVAQRHEKLKTLANQVGDIKSIFLVGRGYALAPCKEGALKIKEMTAVNCEAILSGEVEHGSIRSLNKETMVICLILKDAVHDKAMSTLATIMNKTSNAKLICNQSDKTAKEVIEEFLTIPDTVDCLQGILAVTALQLFSFHLALINHAN